MHHGVDAGRCRDVGGQSERQFRIRMAQSEQPRRDNTLLFGRGRRDDRDRRHLRAGAGRRRRQQQRKAFALGKTDTVDIVEAVGGFGEIGHKLRGIERTAASDRGDQFDFLVTAKCDRPLDDMRRRICLDVVEYRELAAISDKARLGIFREPGVAHTLVGDQQDTFAPYPATSSASFFDAPASNRMLGGAWKVKGFI